MYSNIREFFLSRDYLEVETPILSPTLIPEATIDNFSTQYIDPFRKSIELYMVPSPEIFMKQMIASGSGSIFQISKCFRNCEQIGSIHNPEFTMLEYYTDNFDETDSIKLTQDLIRACCTESTMQCMLEDFEVITVHDAILKYANGTDIEKLQDPEKLREQAIKLGLHVPLRESWDDTFNRIFLTFVEPSLSKEHPVLLTDYPKQIECLALEKKPFYRHRWELYINGIELANCYAEETNSEKVYEYYRNEYEKVIKTRTNTEKVIPDCDNSFADIFKNFPKSSGVAMGLDRLLMLISGEKDINNTLTFPFKDWI